MLFGVMLLDIDDILSAKATNWILPLTSVDHVIQEIEVMYEAGTSAHVLNSGAPPTNALHARHRVATPVT